MCGRTPLTVRLSPQFARDLCTAPEHAPIPEPGAPAVTGGLLFGTIEADVITAHAFRGFPTFHEHATNYPPHEHFEKRITDLGRAAISDPELAGLESIGWCYIRRDPGTGFLERDAKFHNRHFPEAKNILVILNTEREEGVALEIFARDSNAPLSMEQYRCAFLRLFPDTPVVPPLEVNLQAGNNSDCLLANQIASPASPKLPSTLPDKPAPWRRRNRGLWLLSPALLLLAIGVTLAWTFMRNQYLAAFQNSQAGLGRRAMNPVLRMQVDAHGDALLLSWDHSAALVRSAKKGILRIDDGSLHRDVYLDPVDLANGSIVYRPGSNDVKFRLELIGGKGPVRSNTVRVLEGFESAAKPDGRGNAPKENLAAIPPPAYVPAQAIKQVMPDEKLSAIRKIEAGTEVSVQVRIDEAGRVVEAHVKNGTNDNRLLRSAALRAAKGWVFAPATSNGENVPSDHTIVFQFQP